MFTPVMTATFPMVCCTPCKMIVITFVLTVVSPRPLHDLLLKTWKLGCRGFSTRRLSWCSSDAQRSSTIVSQPSSGRERVRSDFNGVQERGYFVRHVSLHNDANLKYRQNLAHRINMNLRLYNTRCNAIMRHNSTPLQRLNHTQSN